MNNTRLKEIRARLEAATPGPWDVDDGRVFITSINDRRNIICEMDADREAEAELIAHAPTDIADLCDEVERLWAEVDKGNEMLRLYKDAMEAMPTKVNTLLAEMGQLRAALGDKVSREDL